MRDRPLIVGLLGGLVAILLIADVSFLVKMNAVDENYRRELARSISLQKQMEELKEKSASFEKENTLLKETTTKLNLELEKMKEEIGKVEKLKNKLEEDLKEELMKKELKKK